MKIFVEIVRDTPKLFLTSPNCDIQEMEGR